MTRRFKHKLMRIVVGLGLVGSSTLPLFLFRGCWGSDGGIVKEVMLLQ